MCVCRMANAFQGEDVRGRTLHTRWQEHRGMPCHGGWLWMLLPPFGSLSHCHRCHRCTPSSDLSSITGGLQLPEDPPPHLQVMVHKAFTNTSAKKTRKNTQIPQELSRGIVCSAPAAQSVCTLALASVLRGPCAGSSLFPSEGALAASAKGFRLITRSSLSPASEIKGTARQQSKSLVRMRFTCRDGFRTCHGEEQQKDHVC